MPKQEMMNAICAQLLTHDDITLTPQFTQEILDKKIVVQVLLDDESSSIRIYSKMALSLSDIMPLLQDFGFKVINEVAFSFESETKTIHVKRFFLEDIDTQKLHLAKEHIETIIAHTLLEGSLNACILFSLIYQQNLSLRQLMFVKAMVDYLNQAVVSINRGNFLQTLTHHHEITKALVHYFYCKFDPSVKEHQKRIKEIEVILEESIKKVPNITDDKILRLTTTLIRAMQRTNYFLEFESIAFKVDTTQLSQYLKGIQPRIESFVSHPSFSGIHLRMSTISRGGLRWSDRHDDFRVEVKSLMTTQEGKNAIIIPDGAKGGFVIHKEHKEISKAFFTEVYSLFIHALLDLVDNRVDGKISRDKRIVAYDQDDAYFVVAADKGTASMSDVANAIALKRNYWLGDAFASGGSNGFGHKELGITARGAMRSTERFFIEQEINIQEDMVSVIGIGSMKGDVFGNGMLYSKNFKLLGAIGHSEIFIDPDPIPSTSYEERLRLFHSEDGSWKSYNKALISKGGGVFSRKDKSITLTPEIQKLCNTKAKTMSGEELVRCLLCLDVQLLFNGGVGTYIKHSEESNLDIGDKQNEAVRIDADALRCDIICEGGNLGLTQRARIEYAKGGGMINIDGIDNAAGVDTSDHEVNLKIILNTLVEKSILTPKQSKEILKEMTPHVVNTVLWSNYKQALILSRDEHLSQYYLDDFEASIEILCEHIELFNRRDFFIPKYENISEILTPQKSIVRPILSNLLSYAKIFVKNFLLESELINELESTQYLFKYFPKPLISIYEHEILEHPLRKEIIATVMADTVINLQGITFIHNFESLGNKRFEMKIRSYLLSNQLFGANTIRHKIFREDYKMELKMQYQLLDTLERTLSFSTRWMIRYLDAEKLDANHILGYKEHLFELLTEITDTKSHTIYIKGEESFNAFFDIVDYLRFAVAAIMIKEHNDNNFDNISKLFYLIIKHFNIIQLLQIFDHLETAKATEHTLKRQLLFYVEYFVVHYTEKILRFQRHDEAAVEAFDNFLQGDKKLYSEVKKDVDQLVKNRKRDLEDVTITVNKLMAIAI